MVHHDQSGFTPFNYSELRDTMFSELKHIKRSSVFASPFSRFELPALNVSLTDKALNFVSVVATALMLWKGLSLVTNTESPIVVVLSGSMEPAMRRGDLLFLALPPRRPLKAGDITVYNVPNADIPIVHRVIEVHDDLPEHIKANTTALVKSQSGVQDQWLMTKGDNNPQDDISLYRGLKFLRRSNIVGKVQGYLPYVGYVTIVMNDYPNLNGRQVNNGEPTATPAEFESVYETNSAPNFLRKRAGSLDEVSILVRHMHALPALPFNVQTPDLINTALNL
ncbi:MAG: Signal peptidase complex catalytic subunit [Cyphobasidiales sp. Tagirdzhanova-0007]|nr:MAG: Signal peptidase complex catalytic subunit [Cyphobasidiales sp. Tagirdzhanova-0007]